MQEAWGTANNFKQWTEVLFNNNNNKMFTRQAAILFCRL